LNFNYSYRAFLITSLLFGFLFTILFGVKIKSKLLAEEESYAIEFDPKIVQEENLAQNTEQVKIETNIAFNEAEAFIRELEHERDALDKENKLIDETTKEALESVPPVETNKTEKTASESKEISEKQIASKKVASRTTIRYNLAERNALELPNPVYTCDNGGKVVITIEVNDYGKVIRASYNKKGSTTENGCLIDSALDYARTSKFTSKKDRKRQLGSISYSFPGQQR